MRLFSYLRKRSGGNAPRYAHMRGKGAAMSEENTGTADGQQQEEPKTFTQEQVDAIVKQRLARAKSEVPSDYEELKAKAAKYDETVEAGKSEVQRLTEERDNLLKSVNSYKEAEERRIAVQDAAKAHNLSAEDTSILERMTGDVAENAELLATLAGARQKYPNVKDDGESNPPSDGGDPIRNLINKRS